jgi:hypothetical protein
VREWHELLLDLKRRGLAMGPEVAVADGALGFWQAIEEWPQTRGQHCRVGPLKKPSLGQANQSAEQAGAGTSMARRLCNPDAFKPVSVRVPRLTRGATVPTVSRPVCDVGHIRWGGLTLLSLGCLSHWEVSMQSSYAAPTEMSPLILSTTRGSP